MTIPTGESILMSDGFSTWDPFSDFDINSTPVYSSSSVTPSNPTTYVQNTIWVPPVAGTPGTPSLPTTYTEIRVIKNKGWNTWARSIEQLTKASFFNFTCYKANEGLFLGVGPSSQLGNPISSFSHAIIADVSGIKVYEFGVVVATLLVAYSELSNIKIFYQADGSVVYVVTTSTETLVHTSSILYTLTEAYIYGYIYSSDDEVLSHEYITGSVQYGSV